MNYSNSDNDLRDWNLGRCYDFLSQATRDFVDDIIRADTHKFTTIKFLRNELGLGLTEAKRLYEGRERFLNETADPFGWK